MKETFNIQHSTLNIQRACVHRNIGRRKLKVEGWVFSILLSVCFSGCSSGQKPSADKPGVPVLVAQSVTTNVPVQIQPPPVGHIVAYSSVTVHSQIGGILQQVNFTEGAEVKSNDLLFTIDPRPAQATLAHDQAQLAYAQAEFNRDEKLFQTKIESQDQFDSSKANRDTLAATVRQDQLNLEFTEIRAPFDGVTGALQKHAGDVVKAPDDTLVTLNQIRPIYAEFAVPEQYLPEIRRQMTLHPLRVSASFDNMNGPAPQGELTFVDNSVDPSTGTIDLRATFPNESGALWPGQFVAVTLTLSELTNAVVVPTPAVQTGQNGEFIYAVKPDQTVEERPVKSGITFNGETEIKSGLQAGETVVTDGQLRLAPGVKVTMKK